jgi:5-deoxy-glucuronate isomerase
MDFAPIAAKSCVVRSTHARDGHILWIAPAINAAARHLHYGRIRLAATDSPLHVGAGTLETGLVSLGGEAHVQVGASAFTMRPYDALYVPRATGFAVTPAAAGCDLAEIAAPVEGDYPLQFVSFADVQRDPGLHFTSGGPASQRTINVLLGKNVTAGRIVVGVTFSEPGNWTSWPPHEHTQMLEEAYLYVAMPAPSFGVQMVYSNPNEPELVTIVREGDVVLMPQGYHPNVAAPGCTIGFVWMMAANREVVDRQFGVVNVQPEFSGTASGLDRGRAGAVAPQR